MATGIDTSPIAGFLGGLSKGVGQLGTSVLKGVEAENVIRKLREEQRNKRLQAEAETEFSQGILGGQSPSELVPQIGARFGGLADVSQQAKAQQGIVGREQDIETGQIELNQAELQRDRIENLRNRAATDPQSVGINPDTEEGLVLQIILDLFPEKGLAALQQRGLSADKLKQKILDDLTDEKKFQERELFKSALRIKEAEKKAKDKEKRKKKGVKGAIASILALSTSVPAESRGPEARLKGAVKTGLAIIGLAPMVQSLRTQRKGFAAQLSKELGEAGRLTDLDIARAINMLASQFDTIEERALKDRTLEILSDDSFSSEEQAAALDEAVKKVAASYAGRGLLFGSEDMGAKITPSNVMKDLIDKAKAGDVEAADFLESRGVDF